MNKSKPLIFLRKHIQDYSFMLMYMDTLQPCPALSMVITQKSSNMQLKIEPFARYLSKTSSQAASAKAIPIFPKRIWLRNKDTMNFPSSAQGESLRAELNPLSSKFFTHIRYKSFHIGRSSHEDAITTNKKGKRLMRWTMRGCWANLLPWACWIYWISIHRAGSMRLKCWNYEGRSKNNASMSNHANYSPINEHRAAISKAHSITPRARLLSQTALASAWRNTFHGGSVMTYIYETSLQNKISLNIPKWPNS